MNLGNGYRFGGGFLKPFGTDPTGRVSTSRVRKRYRTEESSAETLEDNRIFLDITDPGSKDEMATKPSCIKPPEPKIGRRPIVKMILRWNNKERLVRALLDWGATLPLLSKEWAIKINVLTYKCDRQLIIENFSGKAEPEIGKAYSYPLRLQHRKQYSVESFEISPMDSEYDVILPFWWIAKHPPSKTYGPPEHIRSRCKNYTKKKWTNSW
jgi:hypothetical protein